MANGNRRPLAPVRKLFAAVLGTCALFVVLFGIGMKSLAIVALGIALIVLAVGLVLVTTIRGGARAWVAGTAHVHTVSEPPASSVFGRCELQVLIDAPGVAGRLVRMRDPRVPVAKWPDVGASLPIMVAIDDPRHIRILWDDVLTHAEAASVRENDIGPLDEEEWDQAETAYGGAGAPVETIETTTADLTDELSGLREPPEPVVVHQTPGGPIVVEGTLVDPPKATAPPLTHRARPDPRMTRAARAAREESAGGTATATAPPPPAPDVPGQRAGAGPDDVFDFDQHATWAEPLFAERRVSRPARGAADTDVVTPPGGPEAGDDVRPGGGRSDAGDPEGSASGDSPISGPLGSDRGRGADVAADPAVSGGEGDDATPSGTGDDSAAPGDAASPAAASGSATSGEAASGAAASGAAAAGAAAAGAAAAGAAAAGAWGSSGRAGRGDVDSAAGGARSGPANGSGASGAPVSRIRRDDDLGEDLGNQAASDDALRAAPADDDPAESVDAAARRERREHSAAVRDAATRSESRDRSAATGETATGSGPAAAGETATGSGPAAAGETATRNEPRSQPATAGEAAMRTESGGHSATPGWTAAGSGSAATGETATRSEPGDDSGVSDDGASRIRRDDDLGEDLAASGSPDTADSTAATTADEAGPDGPSPTDPAPDDETQAAAGLLAGAAAAGAAAAAAGSGDAPRPPARGDDGDDEDVFADLITAYPSARPGATGATIHGVGLTFLVRDLPRSVAFYRDMLGFLEIDGGEHNAVLASGDTRMVLREIRDASPVNRRLVHLNLEVGDVMSVYEDLRAKGVRFTYPPRVVNRGAKLELWAAAFRDPDGHGIAITQWRSRETG